VALDPLRERAKARAVIKVHRAVYEWAKAQVELVDGHVAVERFGSYIAGFERDAGG
jgi:hypothetical protein